MRKNKKYYGFEYHITREAFRSYRWVMVVNGHSIYSRQTYYNEHLAKLEMGKFHAENLA